MINTIKSCIAVKLKEIYPTAEIYDEEIILNPQTLTFLIQLKNQEYKKRLNAKYNNLLSFKVSCFTQNTLRQAEIQTIQLKLQRVFDLLEENDFKIRVKNKKFALTGDILNFTFDIPYTETVTEPVNNMKSISKLGIRSDIR